MREIPTLPAWLDLDAYPFGHHYIDLTAGRVH